MGLHNIRRDRRQFTQLNYRLKTLLLGLSVLLILVSVILAVLIFSYVFDIATHPAHAKDLVDQWATMFLESSNTSQPSKTSSAFDGPARWFAVITLIVLSYLLIRIPLLMLQMGTQLMISCQEDNQSLRSFVREVMYELKTSPDREDEPSNGT
ncbi:MAG: hypothetical protein HC852_15275 [Acaryochloridaceae cyanobacterium RU_4_10]|nr:hypothetical protein [Acaryochloridaceae cyanobacterium RU_4_10]